MSRKTIRRMRLKWARDAVRDARFWFSVGEVDAGLARLDHAAELRQLARKD